MELHFLGTGAGVPSKQRNVSALALRFLEDEGDVWLFDCGEATQHQLLYSPLSLSKITKILMSHVHGDHLFGLPGLLSTRSFQGAASPLTIYAPPGVEEFVRVSLKVTKTTLRYPLEFVTLRAGSLFETPHHEVEVLPLAHTIQSYAFKVTEKEKPGRLDIARLQAEGVPAGPLYAQLKRGETVQLTDGRVLSGQAFVGEPIRGRVIVIAGDTKPIPEMVDFASGADLLVHEATFASDCEADAHQFGHSTVADACRLAKHAHVKQLILTHISSRYVREPSVFLDEVEAHLPTALVARDLFVYSLAKRGGSVGD
ncbi:ribonuclease Z [Shouchella lonarensis]|uniref:Ribonuclease Z n=1 Tax=Shouchella lonarensis TaxID=1464122 RepID=A0A1G6HBF8_9BACI|nr:ribonuclease Z [Shouchella lonarensis]SDB91493.1 RNAse Z [Shouchella lonarensis]